MEKPLHHNLSRQSARQGGALTTGQQSHRKKSRRRTPHQRTQRGMSLLEFAHHHSVPEKDRGRYNQNRRIHQKSSIQCHGRIDEVIANRLFSALKSGRDHPRLHQRGVKI